MSDFFRVDVKDIKSNRQRSDFDENRIAEIAKSILQNGGLLRPLILRIDGVESYTVLDGDLEYFAAVRAREENPQVGATVNAFLISPRNQSEAKEQIEIIRKGEISNHSSNTNEPQIHQDSQANWMSNLNSRLDFIGQELLNLKSNSVTMLNKLGKESVVKANNLLDLLNSSDERKIKVELTRKGLKEDKINLLLKAKEQAADNQFISYKNIIEMVKKVKEKNQKGIGESGLLSMIDKF